MDEKYLEALEFDKIRARAADGIVCPEARGMLLGQPAWETPDEVRAALVAAGFGVAGVVESPITGPEGNVEYLVRAVFEGSGVAD